LCAHIHETLALKDIPRRFGALFQHSFPSNCKPENYDSFDIEIDKVPPAKNVGTQYVTGDWANKPMLSLPFFSGRDGFQSNSYGVSVPLGSLTAATSLRWSLCNLTHELSHDIIRAILAGYLVPKIGDQRNRRTLLAELNTHQHNSVGSYVRSRFLKLVPFFIDSHIEPKPNGDFTVSLGPGADELATIEAALPKCMIDIEEVMVHCFDFLYFYGSDTARYLKGIWSSWATIPSVSKRVERYLLRSMCAVSLHPYAAKEDDFILRQLTDCFANLDRRAKRTECIQLAIWHINHNKTALMDKLAMRRDMGELVRRFMFSTQYSAALRKETMSGKKFRPLEFGTGELSNPLEFAKRFSEHPRISRAESAWLFNCLAYSYKKEVLNDSGKPSFGEVS